MQKSITASTQTQKTVAIYGHVLGAVVVLGLVSFPALPNLAEQLKMDGGNERVTPGKSSKSSHHTPDSSVNSEVKVAGTSENESHRPLKFYTKGVRDSMFSAPQPPPPPKEKPTPVIMPPQPPKSAYIPPIALVVVNPFADWVYTGTVTMGEVKLALIENTKSKEGQYLKQGESFLGAQVSQVTDQMVTFTVGIKPYLLAKSDTINVVQLDRSAPYLGGAPPPPGAPPGSPPPGMNTPNFPPPGIGIPAGGPPPMMIKTESRSFPLPEGGVPLLNGLIIDKN